MISTEEESYNIDYFSILLYIILVCLGYFAIYSATHGGSNFSFGLSTFYGRQLLWIGVSAVLAVAISLTESRFFEVFSYYFYGIFVLLLIIVLLIGMETNGANSWIKIGSFKIQPTEFSKLGVALAVSLYLSNIDVDLKKRRAQIVVSLIILLPMALIVLQGDAGSSLVFISFILVLYREGLTGIFLVIGLVAIILFVLSIVIGAKLLIIIILGISIILYAFNYSNSSFVKFLIVILIACSTFSICVQYAFNTVLKNYQKDRIEVMLGIKEDARGIGYNIAQSKIAIGSGGFSGKGYLKGTQTIGNFVPEQETDFIFTIVGEEFGWLGSVIVVSLFVILLLRIIFLAERQRTIFKRVYAYCVFGIFFFHFAINISMTINLAPTIGIPLPFFSYGGSSLLTFTALYFILLKMDASRENDLESLY